MENTISSILSVLLILHFSVQTFTRSEAQLSEFLSIDCGATSSYEDVSLGITWDTDEKYIKTGSTRQMKEDSDLPKQLYSYRYFPSRRSKYCYVLPVKPDTTYLLRVRLFPGSGGTSSVTLPVDFSVTFISNLFFSFSANTDEDRTDTIYESVFHSFRRTEINLCLLQGANGTPFINSIELRGLPDTSYSLTRDQRGTPQVMVLGDRLNMGTKEGDDSFFRYPDDDFDRIWWSAVAPRYQFPSFATVNGSLAKDLTFHSYFPDSGADGYNWPPNRTLVDAWVGQDLSFQIPRKGDDTNRVYAAFYFMEIRPEVNISESGDWETISYAVGNRSDTLTLTDRSEYTSLLEEVVLDDQLLPVNVSQQSGSIDGIILNGFEYYYRYDFNYSATFSADRIALDQLQVSFGLEDWQGDPCFPVAWDWLTCDSIATRIIKLNLSHMNISGSIPENISSLVELRDIYLDNNNLQGSIPESLVSLTNLTVLALDNNKLTGDIPSELLNRPGLNFTFSGNPGLSVARPGNISSAPVPGPEASSTSAAVKSSRKVDLLFLSTTFLASAFFLASIG